MNRRNFIKNSSITVFSGLTIVNNSLKSYSQEDIKPEIYPIPESIELSAKSTVQQPLILPTSLKKGSKIGISAPASPTSAGEIYKCISALKKFGCTVEIGKTITNRDSRYKYFSASDEQRANELMEFIKRKDINAVIAGRGGYGVARILPLLDYNIIRENPKIIIGFSDITALINAVYQKSGIITYHGPVAASSWGQLSSKSFFDVLFSKEKFQPLVYNIPSIDVIREGKCSGKLVGGNLSVICSLLGTDYEIDTRGSILFLEEVSEEPYKIDRMMTQLSLAGKLQQANAVVFGYFKNLTARRNFWPVISFDVKTVLQNSVKNLNIPSVIGLPIGHHENNITLPLGIKAELDTKKKSITLLEPAVL